MHFTQQKTMTNHHTIHIPVDPPHMSYWPSSAGRKWSDWSKVGVSGPKLLEVVRNGRKWSETVSNPCEGTFVCTFTLTFTISIKA